MEVVGIRRFFFTSSVEPVFCILFYFLILSRECKRREECPRAAVRVGSLWKYKDVIGVLTYGGDRLQNRKFVRFRRLFFSRLWPSY